MGDNFWRNFKSMKGFGNPVLAIEAKELSKQYKLKSSKVTSVKELVLKELFRGAETHTIWALKNVSFSVEQGKTLGIIGGNGSGKTTLLRLIAGITEPTTGIIKVQGRVATILELGVGFHPELNGIENIYLQGAVLGIPRHVIDKSLDAIIDFAELRQFIYMPLKYYSTGMTLRLGFSIAVNINPDILLIDEVLTVGDAKFQEKSLEKIKEFKRQNKTIVFVTHNLDQAEMLCDEVIWLDNGQIKAQGDAEEVVNHYVLHAHRLYRDLPLKPFDYEHCVISDMGRYGSGEVTIDEVVIRRDDGIPVRHIPAYRPMQIEVNYTCHKPVKRLDCQLGIGRVDGAYVSLCCSEKYGMIIYPQSTRGKIVATFDPMLFQPGKYLLTVELCPPGEPLNPYDMQLRMYTFSVEDKEKELEALRPAVKLPAKITIEPDG